MNKFKKGDKVERIEDSFQGMDVGDTATVTLIVDTITIMLDKYGGSHSATKFKLIPREWDD